MQQHSKFKLKQGLQEKIKNVKVIQALVFHLFQPKYVSYAPIS